MQDKDTMKSTFENVDKDYLYLVAPLTHSREI